MHQRSPLETDLAVAPEENPDEHPSPRQRAAFALDPPAPEPLHAPEIATERLDPDALKVIYRLRHVHHQAYFVGGCVRDLLLDRKPKDFDVATDAHPGEVRAIFRNCRLIGRRFRLAHVYFRGGKVIEVATFRKNPVDVGDDVPDDSDLLITRDNVFGTAEEDSVRRDFTVNGLFYDPATGEVIDYVGGRADLEAHRIATIGDPEIRMREDPVRALRAIRFASRLGFTIAPDTFEAMRRHAGELARCAPARVLEETFKILRCGSSARAFELLRSSGALPFVLPAFAAALEGWDEARRRSFAAHLAALDRLVRGGAEVSEAVLLGALVMHLGPSAPRHRAHTSGSEEPAAEPRGGADAMLAGLVLTARLPRKIAERTRLALHAQRLFKEPPKRRRRGRGLAGQTYFQDALQLLGIEVEATGEGADLLERWSHGAHAPRGAEHEREDAPAEVAGAHAHRSRRVEAAVEVEVEAAVEAAVEVEVATNPPAEAAPAADGQPSGRKRRRRRGGRRRRRRGSPSEGSQGAPPAASGA